MTCIKDVSEGVLGPARCGHYSRPITLIYGRSALYPASPIGPKLVEGFQLIGVINYTFLQFRERRQAACEG